MDIGARVSWKGTEKCTSIPRTGIELHENNGTRQITGRGGRAGRGRGLKHGREGKGRHRGPCRSGPTGLEESPSHFFSGTKVSSVIEEINEEQKRKLYDLVLRTET